MKVLTGKYVVLGGSGLIGTSVLSLLKDCQGVDVVSTYFARKPRIFAKNISHIQIDLRERNNCDEIIGDADYVILLASNIILYSMPENIIVEKNTSNLLISSQVLESCYKKKIKKLIWASSTTGYPSKDGIVEEDDMFVGDPQDKYFFIGWLARFIEKLCVLYSTKLEYKLPISIVRPTCVYGENEGFDLDKCHMLPTMVKKIIDGETIEIWGDGERKTDFIHADDVARACISLLKTTGNFNVFNLGTGNYYSVNEIIRIICEIEDSDLNVDYVNSQNSINNDRLISVDKIKKEVGFTPLVDIHSGVKKLIKEYKDNYA